MGVDYQTYSQDTEDFEKNADKSSEEFMNSYEREFGETPDDTKNSVLASLDIGTSGAEDVDEVMPDIYIFGSDEKKVPFPGKDVDVHIGVQETYGVVSRSSGTDTKWESNYGLDSNPNVGASGYIYIFPHEEETKGSINIGIKNTLTFDAYFGEGMDSKGYGISWGLSVPLTPLQINTNTPLNLNSD